MESKKDRLGVVFRAEYLSFQSHCYMEYYEIYQFQQIYFLVYYVTAIYLQYLKEIEHLNRKNVDL